MSLPLHLVVAFSCQLIELSVASQLNIQGQPWLSLSSFYE